MFDGSISMKRVISRTWGLGKVGGVFWEWIMVSSMMASVEGWFTDNTPARFESLDGMLLADVGRSWSTGE